MEKYNDRISQLEMILQGQLEEMKKKANQIRKKKVGADRKVSSAAEELRRIDRRRDHQHGKLEKHALESDEILEQIAHIDELRGKKMEEAQEQVMITVSEMNELKEDASRIKMYQEMLTELRKYGKILVVPQETTEPFGHPF